MSNFTKRTISGFLFVAAIIFSVYAGPRVIAAVFFPIVLISVSEFSSLVSLSKKEGSFILVPVAIIYLSIIMALLHSPFPWLVIPLVIIILVMTTLLFIKSFDPVKVISGFVFSVAYVVLPFSSLVAVFTFSPEHGTIILFGLFGLVWANDTFAYLSGMAAGKHRLFPSVSPGKTWEGSIGGALMTVATAIVVYYFSRSLTVVDWIIMALITIIFGTFGDLFESLLKRRAGVKDSGTIMPGHGGLLDRFDSILFTAPVILSYIILKQL